MGKIIYWIPTNQQYLAAIKRLEEEGVLLKGTFDKVLEKIMEEKG